MTDVLLTIAFLAFIGVGVALERANARHLVRKQKRDFEAKIAALRNAAPGSQLDLRV